MILQVYMFLTQFWGLSMLAQTLAAASFGGGVYPIWTLLTFYLLGCGGNIDHMIATSFVEFLDIVIREADFCID